MKQYTIIAIVVIGIIAFSFSMTGEVNAIANCPASDPFCNIDDIPTPTPAPTATQLNFACSGYNTQYASNAYGDFCAETNGFAMRDQNGDGKADWVYSDVYHTDYGFSNAYCPPSPADGYVLDWGNRTIYFSQFSFLWGLEANYGWDNYTCRYEWQG